MAHHRMFGRNERRSHVDTIPQKRGNLLSLVASVAMLISPVQLRRASGMRNEDWLVMHTLQAHSANVGFAMAGFMYVNAPILP